MMFFSERHSTKLINMFIRQHLIVSVQCTVTPSNISAFIKLELLSVTSLGPLLGNGLVTGLRELVTSSRYRHPC